MSALNVSEQIAKTLTPLDELSEQSLKTLLQEAHLDHVDSGTRLTSPAEENWLTYLVRGEIALPTRAGDVNTIEADSKRAREAIFSESQLAKVAVTKCPSTLLRIKKSLFESLQQDDKGAGIEVQETETDESANSLFHNLYQAYESERLEIPGVPQVAIQVRRLASDPDSSVQDLVKLINSDPSIAGRLVRISNSAMYRGTRPFDNVKEAAIRLGMNVTSQIAASIAMKATFRSKSKLISQRMDALWKHSVSVAAFASVLSLKAKHLDKDRALFAGLMHDVGQIPILNFVERGDLTEDADALDQAISGLSELVGILVVNTWDLGAEIAAVVAEANDWQRDAGDKADYCDLVIIAQLLDMRKEGEPSEENLPEAWECAAARKIGLAEKDAMLDFIAEHETTLRDLTAAVN